MKSHKEIIRQHNGLDALNMFEIICKENDINAEVYKACAGYYYLCVDGFYAMGESACEDFYDRDGAASIFGSYINGLAGREIFPDNWELLLTQCR